MLMRSDDRPIDTVQAPVQVGVSVCLLLYPRQDLLPDASRLPAVEPAGDSLPGAVALGEIPPGCSGAKQQDQLPLELAITTVIG